MNETPSATAILAPIWRRKWLILAVGILVAGGTYLYYKHKAPRFQSETQLYLNAGSEFSTGEKSIGSKGTSVTAAAQPESINSVALKLVRHQLKSQHSVGLQVAGKVKV